MSNSPGDQPWSQLVQTYESSSLLDTVTTGDNGIRSIGVNRVTGSDGLTVGTSDTMIFASGISYNQIWFSQAGGDLAISAIGQNESMTLRNWYSSNANHIGSITSGDGYTISDTGVQAMVEAMASLTPPLSGRTTLPTGTATQLSPALAANWHHPRIGHAARTA